MVYIGIDLGATNIAVGVVSEDGKILYQKEAPTKAERQWQPVVRDMAAISMSALSEAGYDLDDLKAVGMGVPGICVDGAIPFCTNLGWHDVPIERAFREYIDKPLFVDNDATVAGLAEAVSGVSASVSNSVFLTLGTGVGGGIILNKKPYSGSHGVGSELGHMTILADGEMCTCGKRGCLERYASATAMIRMGIEAMREHPQSELFTLTEGDPSRMTAKIVIDAAKAGDSAAREIFDIYIKYLSLGINTVISFIDPEMIVLGGGVSRAGAFLLDAVRNELPKYIFFRTMPYASVELARLGNEAGIIGAAMLGRD
ncbi:MAG: ROK family protein [Oscillospiraceae bacterium]|jgi:glucokinase|nr:ROK family protein [Oscillospiraceae bacterium]